MTAPCAAVSTLGSDGAGRGKAMTWQATGMPNNFSGDTVQSLDARAQPFNASARSLSATQDLRATQPMRSLAEEGIPAGCVSSRTAGVKGGMGDHGIDAYSHMSPLHKSSRSNLDPRGHGKLDARSNPRASIMRGQKPKLGASSGLIGQPAGSVLPWDRDDYVWPTPRSLASSRALSATMTPRKALPRTPAEDGIPAGCVSGRSAGVKGGMGDHGIDAYSHNSPLHKSARSNLDPRDHGSLTRSNPRASIMRGREIARLGASSGLIGQSAGSTLPWEAPGVTQTPRSLASSRAFSLPNTLPKQAGVRGYAGDSGIDQHSVNSPIHRSARSNVDPRADSTGRGNVRSSLSRAAGKPRVGVSSGLIGQPAGSTLPWEATGYVATPRSLPSSRPQSTPRFAPPARSGVRDPLGETMSSLASDHSAMPVSQLKEHLVGVAN